ncbi:hypothetical protein Acr_00g0029410 [Actinidia rufa]|uniref:Uncharacterized protein n=1 Tax=Actinidia rufa TaxID=165716 RepID=A0A7J0DEK6_9ERIC|nr:hypothetical protein Acr_00g0029410 [Actinidia rufa]
MFDRADIGYLKSLEDSLPSWISEHLGERSYMSNEVNQLPLPPPDESPPRDKLPGRGENPGVDTHSSPATEINIVSQDDLDRLRESYSFPAGVQTRIPEEGETILSTRTSEVTFYEAAFPTGLRRHLSLNKFRCLYTLFNSPGSDSGWLYFKARLAFQRCFALDHAKMSSSGRDNTDDIPIEETGIVGDEARQLELEFKLKLRSYVRIMAPVRAQIGWYYLYSFSSVSPFLYFDVGIRFVGMLKRISLKKLAQKVEKAKGVSSVSKSTPAAKGVVIREKCSREETSNVSLSEAKSKGKALPPPVAKKIKLVTSNARCRPKEPNQHCFPGRAHRPKLVLPLGTGPPCWGAAMAKTIMFGAIPAADKEKVDKLSLDQAVVLRSSLVVRSRDIGDETTFYIACAVSVEMEMVRAQNWTIELEWLSAKIVEKEKKVGEELQSKYDALARIEEEVAELKKNKALAKKKVVEEYQASEEFHEAVENASSKYFGKGFDFAKGNSLAITPISASIWMEWALTTTCLRRKRRLRRGRRRRTIRARRVPSLLESCIFFCELPFSL